MIQRNILLALRPEHRERRSDLAAEIQRLLRSRPMVAAAWAASWDASVEAERPGWDLVVTVHFQDQRALDAYGADPPHAAFVRDQLVPVVAARQAFNLVLGDTP